MDVAIQTHGLTKIFERPRGWWRWARTRPVTAVSDITLTVASGECFGLLGPNGAGKTTLVKMLCTLILPSSGSATIAGYPLEQAGTIRGAVGLVVSDERSFYWRLPARRNLDFFAAMYGLHGRTAARRIEQVLAEVELSQEAGKPFSHLSSGMRQRLAIARSLLHRPQILFLDEPSRSLDPTATRHLHALITRLMAQQQMTIFLITHDLNEAEKLCHRVALMHQGRIGTIGRPAELRRQLHTHRRYTMTVDALQTADLHALQPLIPTLTYEPGPQSGRLSFRTGVEEGGLTAVIDYLYRHQLAIHNIEAIPPSLEDVFAHYTGESDA